MEILWYIRSLPDEGGKKGEEKEKTARHSEKKGAKRRI
jgi:hypothetical protein